MNPYSRESLLTYTLRRGPILTAEDWRRFLRWETRRRKATEEGEGEAEEPGSGGEPDADGATLWLR